MVLIFYAGLNRFGLHSLTCVNAWPMGTGTIRRYGFVGVDVSLWGWALKSPSAQTLPKWKRPFPGYLHKTVFSTCL
jgi:beta-glucosidase/6-phospho-beta-glucosidase/beta-galactosidase